MKKLMLVLLFAVFSAITLSASDTFTKRWRGQTLSAEVIVKSLKKETTLESAYSLVKDRYNRSVALPVLRSAFINELAERDYRLNKEKIHLIFLKNWKQNDDEMTATCIIWYDETRWMYICLEEI